MYGSIVVGTDGSETAGEAVRQATALAALTGAHLHVVSASQTADSAMFATAVAATAGMPLPRMETDFNPLAETAAMLDGVAADIASQGVVSTLHPCRGPAAGAILDVAKSQKADLIVLGSRGMTGVRRVLGSVPNSVAHGADCAVLIVKTD